MQFGVQFFPDVRPEERDAATYFADALDLAEEADRLGYGHIRIVEHYFHYYGGYSPNPIVFLAAAAQRTRRARLVTGAVLPAFNHPLKLAGEIAMLDAISGGRLDVGFARAFLPHEFRRFGRSPDESVARFREGIEQVDLLLREENVSHRGRFHTIENTTSLPRPTQKPRPKFYVAALNTPESFEYAGRMGYAVMAIAFVADKMRPLLAAYREAWQAAGHPGRGEAMIAFHMFCDADGGRARGCRLRLARRPHLAGLSRLRQGDRRTQGVQRGGADALGRGLGRHARRDRRDDRPHGRRFRRLRARLAAGQFQPDAARPGRGVDAAVRARGDAALRRVVG